jgi:membrane protein
MTESSTLPRTWLPPREILGVTQDAVQTFSLHRTSRMAAALAYFTFFSLFPLLLLLLSLLGFLLDMGQIQDSDLVIQARTSLTELVESNLPGTGDLVSTVMDNVQTSRGASGLIGLLGLLWSASNTFNHLHIALDQIWGFEGHPGLGLTIRRRFSSVLIVLSLGVLLLLAQMLKTLAFVLVKLDELMPGNASITGLVTWLFPFVLAIVVIGAIFRTFPSMSLSWYEVWPGAVLAGIGWELLKWLFAKYAIEFADWQAVYGPVASVIALLTLLYFTFTVVLFGAEFSAAYSRQLHQQLEPVAQLEPVVQLEPVAQLEAESKSLPTAEAEPEDEDEPAKQRRLAPNFTAGTVAGVIGALAVTGVGAGLLVGRVRRLGKSADGQEATKNGE